MALPATTCCECPGRLIPLLDGSARPDLLSANGRNGQPGPVAGGGSYAQHSDGEIASLLLVLGNAETNRSNLMVSVDCHEGWRFNPAQHEGSWRHAGHRKC